MFSFTSADQKAFALARKSFKAFCFLVQSNFECPPHIELLIKELEQVLSGKTKRFAAITPPRHGKSLLVCVLLAAYFLGRFPKRNVAIATYGAELSEGWGRRVRMILQDENFQRIFPDCILSPDSTAAGRFNTTAGGEFVAVGRGGALTGRGADLLLLDDLIKDAMEANSDIVCRSIIEWLQHVAFTRLSKDARVVAISTRWSDRDAMGWILRTQKGWRSVRLPAISEGAGDPLRRSEGAPLWESHFPLAVLEQIRLSVGPQVWAALYQGRPNLATGMIFKREWFRHYSAAPEKLSKIIFSLDTAFKTGAANGFSVLSVWGQNDTGIFLLHLWRDRVEFAELRRQVAMQAQQWKPHAVLIEDRASGQSLIQELKAATLFPVVAMRVDKDKETRANAVTAYFESGRVWFPESAPWLGDLEDELAGFPSMQHDDIVDTTTQALNYLRESGGVLGLVEYIKGLASGIFRIDPEPELSVPEPVTIDQHAVELLRMRQEAENITSNPFSARSLHRNAAPEKLACPKCGTNYSIVLISATERKCNNCDHQWGAALAGQQYRHNRRDILSGDFSDAKFLGPGAPRGNRGR